MKVNYTVSNLSHAERSAKQTLLASIADEAFVVEMFVTNGCFGVQNLHRAVIANVGHNTIQSAMFL